MVNLKILSKIDNFHDRSWNEWTPDADPDTWMDT